MTQTAHRPAINADDIAQARALLDAGRSLPNHWYTSRQIFDIERLTLFRNSWLYFGHESQLPHPGTYATESVATMPILVTRDKDGVLHAFFNACRHRMHEVVTGCGEAKGLTCPYHGWRYQLTGALTGVPRSSEIFAGDAVGFDKDEFGLAELRIETWSGLIFINANLTAPGLRETWGPLLEFAESNRVATGLVPVSRDEQIVEANWKTLVDNVIECYHCASVHPQLAEVFDVSAKGTVLTEFSCGSAIQLPLRGEHSPKEQAEACYHAYFMPPTAYLSARGEARFFMTVVDPITEGTSRLTTHFMGPKSMSAEEVAEVVEAADLVNRQDSLAAAAAQRGYALEPGFEGYQLPHSEQSLRKFARFVLNAVSSP